MKINIPAVASFLIIFLVFNSALKSQNIDSIFSLKDYERTIMLGDTYREALLLKDVQKAGKIKLAVNKEGTPAEKLYLEKVEKDFTYWKTNDNEKKFVLETETLPKFKEMGEHLLVAGTYMGIAEYYEGKGTQHRALENYMYAYDELAKDPEGKFYRQSWYLHRIAGCYYRFKDYKKAIKIATFTETLDTRFSVNAGWFIIINPNLAGMAYLRNGDYDSARIWLQKTYNRALQMKNNPWLGIAGGNIGSTYYMQKRYSEAVPYFLTAIDTCTAYKLWDNVSPFCSNLADCYIHLGQLNAAAPFLEKAENTAQRDRQNGTWLKYYTVAAGFYKLAGNTSLAFECEDSAKTCENKLTEEFDIAKKVRTEADWAYHKTQLQTEVTLQKAKKEKSVLYSIIAVAALLSVIGVLYYKRQKLRFLLNQEHLENEKLKAEEGLLVAKTQLNDFTENLRQKNELIEKFNKEMEQLRQFNNTITDEQVASMEALKQSAILTDADWNNFKKLFDKVHPGYLTRLRIKFGDLTPAETRYILLEKLGLSSKEMAGMLGVSGEAIRHIRFRVKKKLQLENLKELEKVA